MNASSIYDAADLYDLAHPGPAKGELEFYLRQARRWGSRVLELACGTGRLTLPLAAHDLEVTGLDSSPAMLARAREKAAQAGAQVEFIQADMRDFRLGKRFNLVFIPINSICHLFSRRDVEGCFACVRQHLEPNGRFLIDVFNPSLAILSRDSKRWYEVAAYTDAQGRRVRLSEQNQYNTATQVNHITWRFEWDDGSRAQHKLAMRQYFPQELEALLAYNGFVVAQKYGKYGEKSFHSKSVQQLVVARLASDHRSDRPTGRNHPAHEHTAPGSCGQLAKSYS